jgi:hypothetical protein
MFVEGPVVPTTGPKDRTNGRSHEQGAMTPTGFNPAERSSQTSESKLESLR